jgi:hypothetical protein
MSSVGHDNQSLYSDAVEFYRVPNKICSIEQIRDEGDHLQWNLDNVMLMMEGSAQKNYNLWSVDVLKNIRIINNRYCKLQY